MAITAQQERELLNAMQDYVDTTKRADRYMKHNPILMEKQEDLNQEKE